MSIIEIDLMVQCKIVSISQQSGVLVTSVGKNAQKIIWKKLKKWPLNPVLKMFLVLRNNRMD